MPWTLSSTVTCTKLNKQQCFVLVSASSEITQRLLSSVLEMLISKALLSRQDESPQVSSVSVKAPGLCTTSPLHRGVSVREKQSLQINPVPPPVHFAPPNGCIWYNLKLNTSLLFRFYTTDLFSLRSFPCRDVCLLSLFTAGFQNPGFC